MAQPQNWSFGSMMDIFPEFGRLRREVNRLISAAPFLSATPFATDFPAVNVWEGQEDAVVTLEVPGIDSRKLDLSIAGDVLKISGSREMAGAGEAQTYYRQERSSGSFIRTLQLPFHVEAEKAEARYEKGILQILLPRAESEKPKKITVKND